MGVVGGQVEVLTGVLAGDPSPGGKFCSECGRRVLRVMQCYRSSQVTNSGDFNQ